METFDVLGFHNLGEDGGDHLNAASLVADQSRELHHTPKGISADVSQTQVTLFRYPLL